MGGRHQPEPAHRVSKDGAMTSFVPFDASVLESDKLRLSDYGLEPGPGSPIDHLLFGYEWVRTNGFYDKPSKRVHLMYLHLYGNSGSTVRKVIAGLVQSDAYGELHRFDWGEVGLDRAIEVTGTERTWRQAVLAKNLLSGRIPLFRGVHCLSPFDETDELSPLQRWAQQIVEKGRRDGTLEIDGQSGEPTGFVRDVQVFTNTVDSWTPSLLAAKHWSKSSQPGNEFCMVMAAEVAHDAVVFWRNDGGADEVVALGGTGTANVYFQRQSSVKATQEELDNMESFPDAGEGGLEPGAGAESVTTP